MRLLLLVLLLPFSTLADEIYKVEIDVTVHKDRSITVKEYYEFMPGGTIKRGLTRTLPVKYFENAFDVYPTPVEMLSVKVDGKESSYHNIKWMQYYDTTIGSLDDPDWVHKAWLNKTYFIGSSNIYLTYDRHTTTLEYKVQNVVREVNGKDVFGWNFHGTEWTIERDSMIIHVHFPEGFECKESQFLHYTIRTDSLINKSAVSYDSSSNTYSLHSGKLKDGMDITGYFHFKSGTFNDNSNDYSIFFYAYTSPILLAIAIFFCSLVWFVVWFRVGRDPRGLIRTTRVDSPNDLSPAECRYFRKGVVDKLSSVASVVHAAVHKLITIEKREESDYFTLEKTDHFNHASTSVKSAFKKLFSNSTKLKVEETESVGKKFYEFKTRLKKQIEDKYPNQFKNNVGYYIIGLVPAVIMLGWAMYAEDKNFGYAMFFYLFVPLAISWLFYVAIEPIMEGDATWKSYSKLAVSLAGAVVFIILLPVYTYSAPFTMFLIILLHFSAAYWRYLMKNRTAFSKDIESKIMGYEHYLKQTEERYLDFLNNPNEAPVLFEKNLPYAIALECESRWAEAFEKAIKEIPNLDYNPNWARNMTLHYLTFSMASQMVDYTNYSTPSGSGFSGGGFSGGFSGGGGGFGGGGGGGW